MSAEYSDFLKVKLFFHFSALTAKGSSQQLIDKFLVPLILHFAENLYVHQIRFSIKKGSKEKQKMKGKNLEF